MSKKLPTFSSKNNNKNIIKSIKFEYSKSRKVLTKITLKIAEKQNQTKTTLSFILLVELESRGK